MILFICKYCKILILPVKEDVNSFFHFVYKNYTNKKYSHPADIQSGSFVGISNNEEGRKDE